MLSNGTFRSFRALRGMAAAVGALLLGAAPAGAMTIDLAASMDGAQANAGAGTGSPGTGSAVITLDPDTNTLSWVITWQDLIGTPTLMHFHGPAFPDQNAGVQVGTGVVGPPVVGAAVLSDDQEADLLAGLWYLNLHTTEFDAGEIRGQVLVIPEPSAVALLGAGLVLLTGYRRARRV